MRKKKGNATKIIEKRGINDIYVHIQEKYIQQNIQKKIFQELFITRKERISGKLIESLVQLFRWNHTNSIVSLSFMESLRFLKLFLSSKISKIPLAPLHLCYLKEVETEKDVHFFTRSIVPLKRMLSNCNRSWSHCSKTRIHWSLHLYINQPKEYTGIQLQIRWHSGNIVFTRKHVSTLRTDGNTWKGNQSTGLQGKVIRFFLTWVSCFVLANFFERLRLYVTSKGSRQLRNSVMMQSFTEPGLFSFL